jgi:hypothetical protein
MKKRRKSLTAEQRAALSRSLADVRAELGGIRAILERRLAEMELWEADEARRRARLRQITFGLLGRS